MPQGKVKSDNHVSLKKNIHEVIILNSFMNSICMRIDHATRFSQPDTSFMLQKKNMSRLIHKKWLCCVSMKSGCSVHSGHSAF